MTDEHHNALKSLAEDSFEKVTISDKFFDKLSLHKRHIEVVRAQTTREQQVKTLLDIVSRQPDSAFTQLLYALDDTRQTEAASYLRQFNGRTGAEKRYKGSSIAGLPRQKSSQYHYHYYYHDRYRNVRINVLELY